MRLINKSTRGKRRIKFNATSTTTGGDDDDAMSAPGARHKQEDPPTSDAYEFDDDAEKDAYELYSEVMLSLLEEAVASERRGGKGGTPIAWL